MMRISETITSDGITSSARDHSRMENPRPGDLVRWADGKLGRIDSDTTFGDGLSVCSDMGSCFLRPNGSTSISGGPFFVIQPGELEPTYELAASTFWNWGDRMPGADQGCAFTLHRPVFRYTGDPERIYTHKV